MTIVGVAHSRGHLQYAFLSTEMLKLKNIIRIIYDKRYEGGVLKLLDQLQLYQVFAHFISLFADLAKSSSFYGSKIA